MFSTKSLQDVLDSMIGPYSGHPPSPSPTFKGHSDLPGESSQMPGSFDIEETIIEYSDTNSTDIEELTQRFDSITALDADEATREYTVDEHYFTSREAWRRDETYPDSDFGDEPVDAPESILIPSNVCLVAFSPRHQQYFEDYGVAWGVQWQIARIITTYPNFTWDHISENTLLELCGANAAKAPLVPELLFGGVQQFSEYARQEAATTVPDLVSPWADYDEEESYIRRERGSLLMNQSGGNITQRMRLRIESTGSGPCFKFVLEHPTKSKSCRFNRFLGSRRLIQCHFLEKDGRTFGKEILDFFASTKLLILGRLYQAFYGHDSKVELMEINEDFGRIPSEIFGDHNRMSLLDLIAWHNNVELNSNQTVGKWGARFALGFSTSLATIMFAHENIYFIEDIYAPGVTPADAAAHEILTDGCGFLNRSALNAIQEKMGWEVFPVHVQARIAGAKGLFVLHPEHQQPDEVPKIWIRRSQSKVKLQPKDSWSPFHYILDVCSGPFFQTPSSIAYEMILCLSHDGEGVPDVVFVDRLRQSLQDIASSHEPPKHSNGSRVLWDSIYNTHRVQQNRLRRVLSPEQQRAHGFLSYEDDDNDQDDNVSAKWDVEPDYYSGIPATTQEQVLGFLQAGFSPTDPWVIEKLVYLQKKLLDASLKKFRITIPKNPLGVLGEGEVFFAPSQTQLEDSSGTKRYCLTGPVIVSRNPCVQRSDARKVTAIDNHQLLALGYHDVVIFSIQGDCSLASILSGGDYDGDTVVLIWDEAITCQFINSDLSAARPSENFENNNFDKSNQKLGDLVARLTLKEENRQTELAKVLLRGAVAKRLEGRYNMFYRNSVYLNGLDHPATVRLGHMFTSCLDSSKSGLTVKAKVVSEDAKRWDKESPACFSRVREEDESKGRKRGLVRDQRLPPFILDTLLGVADEETRKYQERLSKMRDEATQSSHRDEDLARPLEDARKRAQRHGFMEELHVIQKHVEKFREFFTQARGNRGPFSPRELRGKIKEKISIGDRQESARAVSEAYNLNMPTDLKHFSDADVYRVAASYAYQFDRSTKSHACNFCFGVAWAELCAIKARTTGNDFVMMASGYMDSMSMNKKIVKLYREEAAFD